MGNKERLKDILKRQAAAAERERLDEEAAAAQAEKVRSVRVEVIQKWQEQRAHLETYIVQINKETSKNSVQLFVVKNPRQADTGVGMEVDKMEVVSAPRKWKLHPAQPPTALAEINREKANTVTPKKRRPFKLD